MQLLHRSWQRAWQGAGCTGPGDALAAELLACYREPQRRYHTLQHLSECLGHLEAVLDQVPDPAAIELALWFHDAVYELAGPGAASNELRSAQWAVQALLAGGAPPALARQVHDLIMATRHDALPATPDQCWLVDIDLSILGAAPARFDEYERQVRAEYAFVPDDAFRHGRAAVLAGFVARERIFSTPHFQHRLEDQARANLQRSLAALATPL